MYPSEETVGTETGLIPLSTADQITKLLSHFHINPKRRHFPEGGSKT